MKPALVRHDLLELVVASTTRVVLSATNLRARSSRSRLDGVEQLARRGAARPARGTNAFSPRVAAHEHALVLLDVLGPELQAQRHPAHLPVGVLEAGLLGVAVVEVHAHAGRRAASPATSRALGSTASFQSPLRGGMGTITTW